MPPWRKGNKLKLVSESQAPEPIQQIYREIKETLGLPYVSVVFQTYASYPGFLPLHWRAVRPVVATQEFFDLSERQRADAYTRVFNYFDIPDLCALVTELRLSSDARRELSTVVDMFHYANPMLMLLVAAQLQSFEGSVGGVGQATTHPAKHPVYELAQVPVWDETAPRTRRIFEELRRNSGLPFLDLDYRALARWPEFLAAYWDVLRTVVQSPVYEGCHHAVRETAFALAREFPQSMDLSLVHLSEAGIRDEDAASVVRLTELFVNSVSALLINISLAKIALEGGTRPQARPAEAVRREVPASGKERAA
ncbi:MAG: halocarboxylic acid dehydrogenase DehI family protein [Terriglobales bacterium]